MIRSLLQQQQAALSFFFDTIDEKKIEEIVYKIFCHKGLLILSGVGKSGIIANKLAVNLLSIGIKAIFLPPLDALHGDVGIVGHGDICLFFSKSGNTEELLQIIPFIKEKRASLVSIVCSKRSKLEQLSDFSIYLPFTKELCPFNLVPTISTALQLLFGDLLTVALMKKRQFTLEEYAKNHPRGIIGKKITLRVEDLMFQGKEIPFCFPEQQIIEILHELSSKKCGALLVVDEKKRLKGIFTDGDLRRAIQKHGKDFLMCTIQEVMSPSPRITTKDQRAWKAMKQMEEDPKKLITILPVVERGIVIGILRLHDILQAGLREEKII